MTAFYLLLILSYVLLVCVLALFFEVRGGAERKRIKDKEFLSSLYQISFLARLHKSISYPFQPKKMLEAIAGSTGQYLPCSSVSYAFLDKDKIRLRTFVKEKVDIEFVRKVKKVILRSIHAVDTDNKNLPVLESTADLVWNVDVLLQEKIEYISAFSNNLEPQALNHEAISYFNVPLVINNKFIGIINVASHKSKAFLEKDMDMVYVNVKQAERLIEKLDSLIRTEQGKISSVLDYSPSGVVLLGTNEGSFEISYLNAAAKEFLNLGKEVSVVRLFSSFLPVIDLLEKVKQTVKERKAIILSDIEILKRQFKVFISPTFLSASQKVIGVAITLQNITAEIEEEKTHEDFTNMIIHELRAPLVSMKGASELLMKGKISPADKKKMLKLIRESSGRMLHDIGNLLDSAKIEAGKFSVARSRGNFNDLAKGRIEAFSYAAEEKKITLKADLAKDIAMFDFDKSRIEEVFNNLISNSLKFTNPGGMIRVSVKRQGNFVKVEVKDNGNGMPKERQESLFSKYGKSVSSGGEGTGLGLFIAKSIIEAHGGKIWIDSKEDVGTSVYFTIPVVNEEKEPNSRKTDFAARSVVNQKIVN